MRRDLRRFLVVGWTVLDAPASEAVSLGSEWKRRRGYLPPERNDVVRGYHFRIPRGRAVHCLAGDRVVPEAAVARVCALIAAKSGVDARPAEASEVPRLPTSRPPGGLELARIEEWPPPDEELKDMLLLEYIEGGIFVPERRDTGYGLWAPPTTDPGEALVFETLDEADGWLWLHAPGERLQIRYRSAAVAEADLREASVAKGW